MDRVRRIGVLGGMSWQSSAHYYRLLNEMTASRLGGLHSADLVLRSVDFAKIEALQRAGDWARAGRVLDAAGEDLHAAGAEVVVLATNTMHRVADRLEEDFGPAFLHLGDVTAHAVLAAGVTRVGLLGTRFTMEEPFYADRLAGHGLEVVVPNATERDEVHRIIYDELCVGVVDERSQETLRDVVRRLVAEDCGGVVLGCTELELLLTEPDLGGKPLFATSRLHCAAAVEASLDGALRDSPALLATLREIDETFARSDDHGALGGRPGEVRGGEPGAGRTG